MIDRLPSSPTQLAGQLRRLVARTPGARLFAVIDAARHRDAYRIAHELGARCLYDDPPATLASVAPYVAELEPGAPAATELIEHGFGDAWGIFLDARVGLEVVHRHLQQLVRVTGPTGARLLFRFYDPRVLRVFVPTCTAEQLRQMFGPILHFYVEDDLTDELVDFAGANPGC